MTALLELEAVSAFYGRAQILFDITLDVAPGEIVVLLGRNGAGKSTTLKTVIGLVRATSGDIRFKGASLSGLPSHQIAQMGVGYVPEERRIFTDLTVTENLEVGRRASLAVPNPWTPERLFELFPNLGPMRRRRGGAMSGGEQQMLAIARTLMGNPSLLLLDEPSAGLAPVILDDLARSLQVLKREGLSVLLSEQNLPFAGAVGDRACVIESGQIRHRTTMADLLGDHEARRRWLGAS